MLQLLIRYNGDEAELRRVLTPLFEISGAELRFIPLLAGFGILYTPPALFDEISRLPEVYYAELPSSFFYAQSPYQYQACIPSVRQRYRLSGKGTLIGIVDSGIDLTHPDFIDNGKSRILRYWDQTGEGIAPLPYGFGAEYNAQEISDGLVPPSDFNGHGTAVAGIAAGNGTASGGAFTGVAPEAELIIVKAAGYRQGEFPRTAQYMSGIDYIIRTAGSLKKPVAINLSFGNNFGAHNGSSILEQYLDAVAGSGQISVVTGAGNEGIGNIHAELDLRSTTNRIIEFSVDRNQPIFNLQIFLDPSDEMQLYLEAPFGERITISGITDIMRYSQADFQIEISHKKSNPYNPLSEYFLTFEAISGFVPEGIWRIHVTPVRIRIGRLQMWFSGSQGLNSGTRFLTPTPYGTITIPGTAESVLTVGAYDAASQQIAAFSGRGFTGTGKIKPDFIAPGVMLPAPAFGGGYSNFTGTSFAAPVVTGIAALLMEWGIVRGNDPFLFGERLKGVLRRGAVPFLEHGSPFLSLPNVVEGFGKVCLQNSIRTFNQNEQ